jgi:hypothetical protein
LFETTSCLSFLLSHLLLYHLPAFSGKKNGKKNQGEKKIKGKAKMRNEAFDTQKGTETKPRERLPAERRYRMSQRMGASTQAVGVWTI